MAKKKEYIYEIIVDTKAGTASINGTAIALDKLEGKMRKIVLETDKLQKGLGQGASKAGLAGAAVTELGRTISDSNYGMTAMANNLQQLSTLFLTLVSTSGGLWNGLKLIGSALLGPLGIIVAFQVLFMWMEKASMQAKKTASVINNVAIAYFNAGTELEVIRKNSNDLTDTELDNIDLRIAALKEEAKARAQIAEVQRLQSELLKLDTTEATDNLNWWQTAMNWTVTNLGDLIDDKFKGANITKSKFRKDLSYVELLLMGEGANNKEAKSKEISDKIVALIDSIDADVLKRLDSKDKRKKEKGLKIDPFGLVDIPTTTNDLGASALAGLQEFYNATDTLDKQRTANERKASLSRKLIISSEAEQRIEAIGLIGDSIQSFGELVGTQTEAGKHVAAAGAIIQTYAAVTQALNTPGLGLGRIPYAISVGAFGLAQVARIYRTKVPGSGSSGAGSGAVPSEVPIQQPDFNIVGVTRGNQIRDTITDALGRPIRAYVTTKDIRSGQELDRNIVRGATVG